MYRKIEEELKKWKNDYKMPLMLIGARQTGKTYILEDFCKKNFNNYIYINLDKEENIGEIFESTIDPQTIIEKILKFFEKYFGLNLKPDTDDDIEYSVKEEEDYNSMVAEDDEDYNVDE